MVQKSLHVVDREQMFSVHRNNDGIPHLRYQYLRLIFDLHVGGSQQFGVNTLWESSENILPWRPDGESESEGARDGKDGVPDNVPQEGIEEKEDEIHDEHSGKGESRLVLAEAVAHDGVSAVLDSHSNHDADGILERKGQEEVRLGELASEDEDPECETCDSFGARKTRVGGCESLVCQIFPCLAADAITKHSSRGYDRIEDDCGDSDTKLDVAENASYGGESDCRTMRDVEVGA